MSAVYGTLIIAHIMVFQPQVGLIHQYLSLNEQPVSDWIAYQPILLDLETATFESSAAADFAIALGNGTKGDVARFGDIFSVD